MLALGIRYLNGFVAASEPDDRDRPEWPPHPARVFMAIAAAYFHGERRPEERRALEWLESLPPPLLRAPGFEPRKPVTHYVPVNDKPGETAKPPTAIIQSAPQLTRDRQPRTFARAWLDDEVTYLVWPEAEADDALLGALASLCARVTRIGHSMSLVQMWVADPEEVKEVDWVPDDERGELYLRVPGPGTLTDLELRYNAEEVESYASLLVLAEDDADPRRQRDAKRQLKEQFDGRPPVQFRPQISRYQGYRRRGSEEATIATPAGVFSPHLIVFGLERRDGPFAALGLPAVLQVIGRWREALVAASDTAPVRVRALVSGHRADGHPLEEPHLALMPLAFVGHPNADGHLLGLAAALPASLDPSERRQLLGVLAKVNELRLGALGAWRLTRELRDRPPWTLRPEAWTAHPGGATHWATVTPIALDRHPKAKERGRYRQETAEIIATGCENIGLPRPREVVVTPASPHLGTPPAFAFPQLRRKDGSGRRHTHAILVFEEPVRGPVLVGAGRYRGYGVCRPMSI